MKLRERDWGRRDEKTTALAARRNDDRLSTQYLSTPELSAICGATSARCARSGGARRPSLDVHDLDEVQRLSTKRRAHSEARCAPPDRVNSMTVLKFSFPRCCIASEYAACDIPADPVYASLWCATIGERLKKASMVSTIRPSSASAGFV